MYMYMFIQAMKSVKIDYRRTVELHFMITNNDGNNVTYLYWRGRPQILILERAENLRLRTAHSATHLQTDGC